ncbi:MAG: serine/threonine-protein kinase [Planctomycetota bacterium]|nr:serine/threonine-protein kinase [Planctomycetota bacterium]
MLLAGKRAFFLGKYRLEQLLGTGGMGAVFRARQAGLDRTVAIKILSPQVVRDPGVVERFQQEMRAVAALNDPHIVAAFDAESAKDLHFLVMEYVPGEDLGKLLARDGPLPIALACECVRQTALGLQHAADRGMVHRDIKPTNLLLTTDPETGRPVVRILDFGLARFRSQWPLKDTMGGPTVPSTAGDGDLTGFGQLLGTPDYIAPEQARDTRLADARSDLYSLGCTLYRLLTGAVPFPGATPEEKLAAREVWPPPRAARLRADLPVGLDAIITKLLMPRPEDRFQTAREVAQAIAPFATVGERAQQRGSLKSADARPARDAVEIPHPDPVSFRDDTRLDLFLDHLATDVDQVPVRETARRKTGTKVRVPLRIARYVALLVTLIAGLWTVAKLSQPTLTVEWTTDRGRNVGTADGCDPLGKPDFGSRRTGERPSRTASGRARTGFAPRRTGLVQSRVAVPLLARDACPNPPERRPCTDSGTRRGPNLRQPQ